MDKIMLRNMAQGDWDAVKSIYESGIATGMATFETSAPKWRDWDESHVKFARIVATSGETVAGWAAISPVSGCCVYGGVAEVSVYVGAGFRGMGVGKRLLGQLIVESEQNGIWTLQAGIFKENTASARLHHSEGFRTVGYREKIGCLNGAWKDVMLMERRSRVVGAEKRQGCA